MAEMNHFGTRPRAATLWPKNHVTQLTNAPNPPVVSRSLIQDWSQLLNPKLSQPVVYSDRSLIRDLIVDGYVFPIFDCMHVRYTDKKNQKDINSFCSDHAGRL